MNPSHSQFSNSLGAFRCEQGRLGTVVWDEWKSSWLATTWQRLATADVGAKKIETAITIGAGWMYKICRGQKRQAGPLNSRYRPRGRIWLRTHVLRPSDNLWQPLNRTVLRTPNFTNSKGIFWFLLSGFCSIWAIFHLWPERERSTLALTYQEEWYT